MLLGALSSSLPAQAQQQQPIPLNRFQPSPAGDRFYGVPSPYAGEHLVPHIMAMMEYSHQPLVLEREVDIGNQYAGSIVAYQHMLRFNAAMGFYERVAVNLDVPIALAQEGDFQPGSVVGYESPDDADFGELRAGMRVRIWGEQSAPLQLGVGGYLWIPTAPDEDTSFLTSGSVHGMPHLLVGGEADRIVWSFVTGPDLRETREFGGISQGSMWIWGTGIGVRTGEKKNWQLGAEATMSVEMKEPASGNTNAEGMLSARWHFIEYMELGAGLGTGFASGIGTPDFRSVLSLAYSPRHQVKNDRDGDGILDDHDACPDEKGPPSDDPSKNGCPARDRDGDGIADRDDACPDQPGPASEDPGRHGCPPDRDQDGIHDAKDACPDKPGLPHDDPAKNGCPPPDDTDGDGIADPEDGCPNEAGQPNPDPAKNGCPPDRDGDGVGDAEDACPDVPGQRSDNPTLNGCPPDRDGDGILDSDDACPNEKGKPHKDPAKHGCPVVQLTAQAVVINEKVQFEVDKAVLLPASDPILDEVAQVLDAHPELKRIEVQGHTDNTGTTWRNQQLSQQRADAVRDALIKRGVKKERLTAKGYGSSQPIAENKTEEGQQKNRRVAFKILERGSKEDLPPGAAPKK